MLRRIIATAGSRRKSSEAGTIGRRMVECAAMMDVRIFSLCAWLAFFGPALSFTHAIAAEPVAIRDILEEPRNFHLRQVVLEGTVRNVQPLDPYKLPAGTMCYGAYLFYLEDETASINVAVFGVCGVPTVKDPDVEEGARVQLQATIQAPSHGGYYLSFQGLAIAGEREGVIQAVADRITPLTESGMIDPSIPK